MAAACWCRAGRRIADAFVIELPIEIEASNDRRQSAAQVDNEHLQLWVAIEHAGGDHPGAVNGRVEGPADRLVQAVLHQHFVPDRHHRRMNMDHDVIRRRELPEPFRLGAVEEGAIRAVAVAGRHRDRLRAAVADQLLDNGLTALFESVGVGHQRKLAGKAILDLQVFVVQELEGVARADLQHLARKPLHLAAIAGNAEGDAAFALLGHGVVQVDKIAIANEVQRVGLREFLFRIVQPPLRQFGGEFGSDRVPVGIDDWPVFRCVRRCHGDLLEASKAISGIG
jgi:hypothetical protein